MFLLLRIWQVNLYILAPQNLAGQPVSFDALEFGRATCIFWLLRIWQGYLYYSNLYSFCSLEFSRPTCITQTCILFCSLEFGRLILLLKPVVFAPQNLAGQPLLLKSVSFLFHRIWQGYMFYSNLYFFPDSTTQLVSISVFLFFLDFTWHILISKQVYLASNSIKFGPNNFIYFFNFYILPCYCASCVQFLFQPTKNYIYIYIILTIFVL